jgi:hypothetical protein
VFLESIEVLSIYLSTMYLSINLAYQNIQLISVSNLDISNRSIMDGHLILSQILEYARQNSEKYAWNLKNNTNYKFPFLFSRVQTSKPVQIIIPCESHSLSIILFVQMPSTGVFDGIHFVIELKASHLLGRYSTTWITPPAQHFNAIIFKNPL